MTRLFPEMVPSDSGESTKYHSFTITITLPTSPTTTAPYIPSSTPAPSIVSTVFINHKTSMITFVTPSFIHVLTMDTDLSHKSWFAKYFSYLDFSYNKSL